MNDTLPTISVDTIHQGIDTAYLRSLNFPFLPKADSFPFKRLTANELASQNQDSITERFLTVTSRKPVLINPQPIIIQQNDWQAGILIFCIFIISYIRITRKKLFKDLLLGLYSMPMFKQMIRDGVLFSTGIIFPMTLVVLLTYTVFAYQLFVFLNPAQVIKSIEAIRLLFYFFGGISVILLLKTIVVRSAGFIFKTSELTDLYLSNSYFFHIITSITLLPVLLLSIFDKSLILTYVTIILFVLLFIYNLLRGIIISMEMRKYSLYQNLFYLCTLEFLPIFIIIKAII